MAPCFFAVNSDFMARVAGYSPVCQGLPVHASDVILLTELPSTFL
jgi:hypothetical protein